VVSEKDVRWRIVSFLFGLFASVIRVSAVEFASSLSGAVSGEVKLFATPPDFTLPWKMTFAPVAGGGQEVIAALEGTGLQLRAAVQINFLTGDGSWRIEDAQVDPATWLAAVAPKLAPALAGVVAQGAVLVSGGGTIRQGQPAGRIKVEWRGGSLTHPAQGWTLEGIAFNGEFALDEGGARVVSANAFQLTIGTITTTRFGARNMYFLGRLNERRAIAVETARVEIAGGDAMVDPCELPLQPPSVSANVKITRVGLQDIVVLVPAAGLAKASGRIDGEVRMTWNKAAGFRLGIGHLEFRNDEPAVVRLTPSVGLLTSRVPQHFDFAPAWLGPVARWLRAENPAYSDMQDIELGKTDLRVTTLMVRLTPEGDKQGHTATVQLVAAPFKTGGVVKKVAFDVNVSGPLAAVTKLGLEQGFSFGVR